MAPLKAHQNTADSQKYPAILAGQPSNKTHIFLIIIKSRIPIIINIRDCYITVIATMYIITIIVLDNRLLLLLFLIIDYYCYCS